ncbi:hypothetical protein [Escherichia coli]|uniref:hypothetical protein n=1 Tax=Escherichia coli TaxID=562 RepID=UPI001F10C640|nr:hypothetical protein [Escherichia coli]UMS93876.1 hypothetical protein AOY65_04785 [Escherichia coli]
MVDSGCTGGDDQDVTARRMQQSVPGCSGSRRSGSGSEEEAADEAAANADKDQNGLITPAEAKAVEDANTALDRRSRQPRRR